MSDSAATEVRGWTWRRPLRLAGCGLAAIAVGGGGWLASAGWADLRTEVIRERGASPELAARGRHLLQEAARAHGIAAFRGRTTIEEVATDTWRPDGPWWPANPQRFRAQRRLGSFTSRVELLDGPLRGEIWGIQSWAAYKRTSHSAPRFASDRAIEFYLPTLQYFDELPFRLLDAPLVLYAGEGTYLGRRYERVFVTWGSPEPHGEHDQYLLWIRPETKLVDAARYTLRDAVALSSPLMRPLMKTFGAGTIHYRQYRSVDGVMVAFEQTVTLEPPENTRAPLEEDRLHRLVIEAARFDTVDVAELTPDGSRPEAGDSKP